MRATKTSVAEAIRLLNVEIPNAVAMQQEIERLLETLHARKACIRKLLKAAGVDRHPCAEGCEAVLVAEKRMAWDVDKLENLLEEEQFEEVCPRKPDSAALRQMLTSADYPENRKNYSALRKCAKIRTTSRLELRAPAEQIVQDKGVHTEAAA